MKPTPNHFRKSKRQSESAANLQPGDTEIELGVPILGQILSQELWAKTAIKRLPTTGPLDWVSVFGRSAGVVLDLGCGNGRFVVSSAVRRPNLDHLGIDILPMVVRYATRRGNQRGLWNTRFAVIGAYEFLEQYVADESVDEIHIYHPQPFHEQSRFHQRLMTPSFVLRAYKTLKAQGELFLQTDNHSYWTYIKSVVPSYFDFQELPGPWPEDGRGRTSREIVARSQGLQIYRGIGRRRNELSETDLNSLAAQLPQPTFRTKRERTTSYR